MRCGFIRPKEEHFPKQIVSFSRRISLAHRYTVVIFVLYFCSFFPCVSFFFFFLLFSLSPHNGKGETTHTDCVRLLGIVCKPTDAYLIISWKLNARVMWVDTYVDPYKFGPCKKWKSTACVVLYVCWSKRTSTHRWQCVCTRQIWETKFVLLERFSTFTKWIYRKEIHFVHFFYFDFILFFILINLFCGHGNAKTIYICFIRIFPYSCIVYVCTVHTSCKLNVSDGRTGEYTQ